MSQEKPNEDVTNQGAEAELPPGLKAIEAELAALSPRDDRLNRERLIFLAGQASAAGGGGPSGWVWPVSLAGMTAVAATLLVMLLVRPEPKVAEQVRIVEVPAVQGRGHVEEFAGNGGREGESPSGAPRFVPESAQPTTALAASGPSWFGYPGLGGFRSRASHLDALDWMLAQGFDPWQSPVGLSIEADQPAQTPLPHHQWLKSLLDDQTGAESSDDRPNTPLDPGASS